MATCGYLGFLVGPVVVGAIAARTGLPLAVGAAGMSIALVFLLAPAMRVGSAGGQP